MSSEAAASSTAVRQSPAVYAVSLLASRACEAPTRVGVTASATHPTAAAMRTAVAGGVNPTEGLAADAAAARHTTTRVTAGTSQSQSMPACRAQTTNAVSTAAYRLRAGCLTRSAAPTSSAPR